MSVYETPDMDEPLTVACNGPTLDELRDAAMRLMLAPLQHHMDTFVASLSWWQRPFWRVACWWARR